MARPLSMRARVLMRALLYASRRMGRGGTPSHHALRAVVKRHLSILPSARHVSVEHRSIGGVPTEILRPRTPLMRRGMMYLHGGGYVTGSPRTHRAFTSRLASALRCEVWVPDYRLAPEYPFPAALDDCTEVWRAFCAAGRFDERVLGGESAGGGLSLALAHRARERALEMPTKLYLQSAWLDLRLAGASYVANEQRDVLCCPKLTEDGFARHYAGAHPRDDPSMSPILGDAAGLPPIYVQVSDAEIFYSDSIELVRSAREAGVDVTLEVGYGLFHAWPLLVTLIPESSRAVESLRAWVDASAGVASG